MTITPEQLKERQNFCGSSDIAALFTDQDGNSLDPFKAPADVYVSKVNELDPLKETPAMSRGNRYESALIDFASTELGRKIITTPEEMRFICEDHPIFACNLDGKTDGAPPEIIEAKTTGMTGEWGIPGTDDIPFRVILQTHQQMLCTGMETAHVAVLLGKWGLAEEMYLVERNEDIIKAIIERGEQFWSDYILPQKEPPEMEKGNIETFKRIQRIPNTFADVSQEKFDHWQDLRQQRLAAEKEEKIAMAAVLIALGDAEAANLDDGSLLTYYEQRGADKIDRKALKGQYPEVYAAVSSENRYRVPRVKRG